ncbi:MAG: nitroreductase family protein [Cyanobacteria bacterium P01_F01_bin.42]
MTKISTPETVASIICSRKTEKVLLEVDAATPVPEALATRNRKVVLDAIKTAGWAPFHYSRQVDKIAEPWRTYILWDQQVQKAALYLRDQLNVKSKEPRLAAACSALVLVTWLPEFYDPDAQAASKLSREDQITHDEEHLAAASAMVQNLLLMLTAHGMGNYWSSGGRFRSPEMFDYLGIPASERLLAAVFIEYPEMMHDSKARKPGSQRKNRSDAWIHEVSL